MIQNTILFFSALTVRFIFLFLQDINPETSLIEDELMYWKNSITYLKTGVLNQDILYERLPGVFYYYKLLLILSSENLKILLFLQAFIDAFNCLMIYKISSIIVPKENFIIYCFAALSPLMIIISSQVLSETIFLFFFIFYLYFAIKAIKIEKYLLLNMLLAGLFLGISTSIRSITFPLIFLSLLPIVAIIFYKNISKYKIFLATSLFLIFSIAPISSRLFNNIKDNNTWSLTAQTGTHLAYWVTPMILSEVKNINRQEALGIVKEREKKFNFTNNPYSDDLILRKVSKDILLDINSMQLIYYWNRGIALNLLAPSLILDKKLRDLPHPSYYETGNLKNWIKEIFSNKNYLNYLIFILLASLTSVFSLLSMIMGPILIYKKDKIVFYLTLLYIMYFMIITGPVISPKYIFPILPCIFLYQGITLKKLIYFVKVIVKKNNRNFN